MIVSSEESVSASVPWTGEPGGALSGWHQLQLRGTRQAVPAHV